MGARGEARLREIIDAATQVVAERGYYGMTIQEVADRVGITQAGLLKYVKNKNGLLTLALRHYDADNEANAYIKSHLAMTDEERERDPMLMPAYYRAIVRDNIERARMVQLYLVLRAEAIDPDHPAHEHYAMRGGRLRDQIAGYPWKLPPEYDTPHKIGMLSMCVGSALEGLELRWLGEPDIDLAASWAEYEDILFPLPHWEGYR
ncbi:TetR/AcrR family transcriptional regulator [Bifidobacterium platyrrhinorum]|uniref:TetR family transcriptional regulator n=1 Tax=Bifidobacterium platyrrhinorum TaxID=2661628 RepID=A0A6L9STF3_9BIFI|nr:TetR/AcrR family transcriptional regulator [Bifidobacterium platyrrhinorum]NEG55877.1 TetR family transcriptional regulator [Bifidobacterium platyrrhinorum]